MNIFIAFFFIVVCNTNLLAQNKDSLQVELNKHTIEDTLKVNLLVNYANTYQYANIDSMIIIANNSMQLAIKLDYKNGIANSYKLLGLAALHKNNLDSSINYYNYALNYFEKAKNISEKSSVILSIADVYYRQSKYSLAIDYYKSGIDLCEKADNNRGIAFANMSIGGIYNDLGNYSESLVFYLKALKLFEEIKYTSGTSMCLSNLAATYSSIGDFKNAILYISKCIKTNKNNENKESILTNFMNAGIVYGQSGDLQNSLLFFNKAYELAKTIGDEEWIRAGKTNIAEVYYGMGKFDTALKNYLDILNDTEKIKDDNFSFIANKGIGNIFLKKNNAKESIKYFLKSYNIAKKLQLKQELHISAGTISEAYEKMGDYKNALEYHKIFYKYKDSLSDEKKDRRVQQVQFQYELDKKQALLDKNKIVYQKNKEKQHFIFIALLAGITLLVVIILLMYRSRISKKKTKQQLVLQNEEIQKQASRLEDLNKFKDKTFSVLSHDLRSPINAISSCMMLLDEKILSAEEFEEMRTEINKKLISLNILLDNLLKWAQSYMKGANSTVPTIVNIYEIGKNVFNISENEAKSKEITLINNMPEDCTAFCDAGQIDIVLRNLINNAIKFSNQNDIITLNATHDDKNITFSVADTGIGISEDKLKQLFTITPDISTYGTQGEKGIGLGLLLCYEFIKANNGKIKVESVPNKGTIFYVTLPKA